MTPLANDHHIFFREAMSVLESLLADLGFDISTERYDHFSFGSAYAEYRRPSLWLRLIWDGKDQAFKATISRDNGATWVDVEGRAPIDHTKDRARLENLAKAIRRLSHAA